MANEQESRPPLNSQLTGAELKRWYWLREELALFARELGISASGGKQELTERLAAKLDGRPLPPSLRQKRGGKQVSGSLTVDTVIPAGQRCSQELRVFFQEHLGSAFRFDSWMREFIATESGKTLGEAVAYFHATRGRVSEEIGEQFELNRFTRQWHKDNPGAPRSALQAAWRTYRALPVDAREKA